MKNRRAPSLFAASVCSAFMFLGCNAPMEEEAQAGAGEAPLEQGEQQQALCDPMMGTRDAVWTTQNAYSQYMYQADWCGVGTSLPPGCWEGTNYYYQEIRGYSCAAVGSNGSCYDPDAWWLVSCDSLVECEFDCEGYCYPTSC